MSALPLATVRLLNHRLHVDGNSCKLFYCFQFFSYTFTRIPPSSTVTMSQIIYMYVTHRIFNTKLLYYTAYFKFNLMKKSNLIDWFIA